jgi:hypothetical protein
MENAMTAKVPGPENLEATELSFDDLDQATGGRHHHSGLTTEQVVYGVVAGAIAVGIIVAIFA